MDFIADAQKRAPRWVQRLALEWLWRMLSDPRRLLGRYLANIAFLSAALVRLLWLRWGPVPPHAQRAPLPEIPAAAADESAARRVLFAASDVGRELQAFRSACEADTTKPLVVDLAERDWLDSRQLGELLDLNRRCRSAHRWVCLLVPHPRLAHMLRFVRLDRYIPMAGDMTEALRMLHASQQSCQDGSVNVEPDQRLRVVLPSELTAVNVAGFRAGVDAAWSQAAAAGEVTGVAVNASGTTFLDSAGLGFLVSLRKKAQPLPGGFRCAGFRGNARQTLVIARMEALFADETTGSGGGA